MIWGVGPMFSLPTATAGPAQTGTWAGGISAVVLAMPGPWVVGSLFSQLWPMSDAGGAPETNVFNQLQLRSGMGAIERSDHRRQLGRA